MVTHDVVSLVKAEALREAEQLCYVKLCGHFTWTSFLIN